MDLQFTVLRCPDAVPPETRSVPGGEFAVGRGPGVEWVLPDPERVLSKRHFVVAYRGGTWQIADTSTNGTFLNRENEPIGQGSIRPLRDGDRLRLGSYEIEVRLVEAARGAAPGRGGASPFPFDDPFGAPAPAPVPFNDPRPVSLGPASLAQLPADFDPLAPESPDAFSGPTQADHAPALNDAFLPRPAAPALPDNWDEDLLAGIGAAAPPPPPRGAGGGFRPDAPAMRAPGGNPPAGNMPGGGTQGGIQGGTQGGTQGGIQGANRGMAPAASPGYAPATFAPAPPAPPPGFPAAGFAPSPAGFAPPGPAAPFPAAAPSPPAALSAAPFAAPVPPSWPPSAAPPSAPPLAPPAPADASPFAEPSDPAPALAPVPAGYSPQSYPAQAPQPQPSQPYPAQTYPAQTYPPQTYPPAPAFAPPPEAGSGAAAAGDALLLAALLRGVGLPGAQPGDPAAMMLALGQAFRALVSGLRAVLIARASIKSEFRIEQTMIRARGNNPLKFSAGDDDALAALLGAGRRSDMSPAEAVADALRDIRLHELASMNAMQAAVRALLEGLDPAKLRAATEQGGALSVLPAQRKARAWDAYETLYAGTVRALSDDFDSLFGKAFARAYERALAETAGKEPQ